jgi:hypothetical protein
MLRALYMHVRNSIFNSNKQKQVLGMILFDENYKFNYLNWDRVVSLSLSLSTYILLGENASSVSEVWTLIKLLPKIQKLSIYCKKFEPLLIK